MAAESYLLNVLRLVRKRTRLLRVETGGDTSATGEVLMGGFTFGGQSGIKVLLEGQLHENVHNFSFEQYTHLG